MTLDKMTLEDGTVDVRTALAQIAVRCFFAPADSECHVSAKKWTLWIDALGFALRNSRETYPGKLSDLLKVQTDGESEEIVNGFHQLRTRYLLHLMNGLIAMLKSHTHTHARTHPRKHTHKHTYTHTHTQISLFIIRAPVSDGQV